MNENQIIIIDDDDDDLEIVKLAFQELGVKDKLIFFDDGFKFETVRGAFFYGKTVQLVLRESLFFNQIEFNFDSTEKVYILAEIRVT